MLKSKRLIAQFLHQSSSIHFRCLKHYSTGSNNVHLPRVPILMTGEKGSYTHFTMCERTPRMLEDIIKDIETIQEQESGDLLKVQQGDELINQLLRLRYDLIENKLIRPLNDELKDVSLWDHRYYDEIGLLGRKKVKHHDMSMLYLECYIYRKAVSLASNYSRWAQWDVFELRKKDGFLKNLKLIELAGHNLDNAMSLPGKEGLVNLLKAAVKGNSADLAFQAVAKEGEKHSLKEVCDDWVIDHSEKVYERIKEREKLKVDIILDNSGVELFNDLILSDYLIQKGYTRHIQLHGKSYPWFVSDTTLPDLKWILEFLLNSEYDHIRKLATRWMRYLRHGQFQFQSNFFYTSPYSFWHLPDIDKSLFDNLINSDLLIFKGDLNYRKLIGDGQWLHQDSFNEAIGPFMNHPNLVALKTCKSEPLPGIGIDRANHLDQLNKNWRINGEFGIIQTI